MSIQQTIEQSARTSNRILSIDILRGLVMLIMALDHTRDYFHISSMTANPLDPATTTVSLFFTRWLTHYCAPIFVFLSGLSIYLSSQCKSTALASSFLLKRGLWLIVVEVVFVTLGLTFNPFYNFIILQVIWAIGCSMILLGLFIRGSYKLILTTGIILVLLHNITDFISLPKTGGLSILMNVLITAFGTVIPLGPKHFLGIFYSILPWTGIMFLGYAVGKWYNNDFDTIKRRHALIISGTGLILLFIILRTINSYGDPFPHKDYHAVMPNVLSFLNVSKYPPSLEYFCMTIGPALIFLASAETAKNRFSKILADYGAVPFFYYIIHFYLLHSILVIAFFATGHTVKEISSFPAPFFFRPVNFGFSLWTVYLIWLFTITVLYLPCVWFKNYKRTHNYWWLKYL